MRDVKLRDFFSLRGEEGSLCARSMYERSECMRSKHRTRVPARPTDSCTREAVCPAQDLCTHKDKRNPVILPAQRNASCRRVIRNALALALNARRGRGTALESGAVMHWCTSECTAMTLNTTCWRLSFFYLRACLGKKEKALAPRRD